MRSSRHGRPLILPSCDTMVALGAATRRGRTLFAKNSDRPPGECQPLVLLDRAEHPPGSLVRCQYIEIPQARMTARVLGSRPVWLWGLEHGVNEHGVAIGNETVFGHEAPSEVGLLGMDLVRLALERAATARQAVEILIDLIETHGQGGSGFRGLEFPYNNAFLVADPTEAWILEALGRTWATRRCHATDAISNHVSIAADWDRLAPNAANRARELGRAVTEPLDFAATFRDRDTIPPVMSEGRLRRSRGLLAAARGQITRGTLREILRDHDATGRRFVPGARFEEEQYHTLCMHQGVSRTAASLIAELDPSRQGPQTAWASFGRPCASVFFPVIAAGELPRAFREGSDAPSECLWWTFEQLAARVEEDLAVADRVRKVFDELEEELENTWDCSAAEIHALGSNGDERIATEFMATIAARVEQVATGLLRNP